jgi:glycosyltransferase involved in cell wall biosynthesis
MPVVTVITATYNCAATLATSLASLLAQDFQDFEGWVVGDACTDDSAAVVRAFADPRLHWVNLDRNSGSQAAPNNEGLARARGEYVAYLGHDDLWFPWHLSTLLERARQTGVDLVHGLAAVFDPDGPFGVAATPPRGVGYADHFVPPTTWLHRFDVVTRFGKWADPDRLACGVDFEFSRRLALRGARFALAPRLSALKYPSGHFALYAAPNLGPQHRHYEAMRSDAHALEVQVLTDLAIAAGQHPQQFLSRITSDAKMVRRSLAVFARRRLVDPWRDAWWMAAWLRVVFQVKRRRTRRRRGLP